MSEERKFDEAAFDKAVAKPNGWSGVADPVAEIRKMRDGDEAFCKDVLRKALSLVRAHFDGADDVFLEKSRELAAILDESGRGALASFVRAQTGDEPSWVPMELKPRVAPGNAAAMREALENVERVARFCAEMSRHTPAYPTDAERAAVLYSRIAELGRIARAALSAPTVPPYDSAKMREAILAIKELNDRRPHDAAGYEINDIIEEALSAPARNCDRCEFWEDLWALEFVKLWLDVTDDLQRAWLFVRWLFKKAKQEGGAK